MPAITAIKATRRDPQRVTVHVDGRVAATVSVRSVAELGLRVGDDCDSVTLARLQRTASVDKAVKQAMNRLGRRAMSRGQLDRKLRELEYDEPTRTEALDRLTRAGLLDDRAFAEAVVRELKRRRPAGPMLLRQKLREKLLDTKLIDAVIAEQTDREGDAAGALELARKRAAQLGRLDPQARRRRIYGLLARRGFSPDVIGDAMGRLDFSDAEGDGR